MKWSFIALFLFLISLFFREQRLPDEVVKRLADAYVPTGMVAHAESVSFGFIRGLHVRNFRLYDRATANPLEPIVSVASLSLLPLQRRIVVDRLSYPKLPDSYYAPGNNERD